MSIEDLKEKIKGVGGFSLPQLRTLPDDLFLGLIIVLVAFGSFGLGRLSKIESTKTPIRIENEPQVTVETFTASVAGNKAPTNVDQSASAIVSASSASFKESSFHLSRAASNASPRNGAWIYAA